MGNDNRSRSVAYVPPQVADGISISCPGTFGVVRLLAVTSIVAGAQHFVYLSPQGSVVIGRPQVVGVLIDPKSELIEAISRGCSYFVRFERSTSEGETTRVEVLLE